MASEDKRDEIQRIAMILWLCCLSPLGIDIRTAASQPYQAKIWT